jgi:hypothetical protein
MGPRRDERYSFTGSIISTGPVFDSYVGLLGKRVPFAMHAQNAVHYWPRPVGST